MDDDIIIKADKLYKLIQETKELRQSMPKDDKKYLLKRHKLKIEGLLLDKILINKGIDTIVKAVKHETRAMDTVNLISDEEDKE